nr:MAG TPA: hypothetical protein [Caudoviricetes sp.]
MPFFDLRDKLQPIEITMFVLYMRILATGQHKAYIPFSP